MGPACFFKGKPIPQVRGPGLAQQGKEKDWGKRAGGVVNKPAQKVITKRLKKRKRQAPKGVATQIKAVFLGHGWPRSKEFVETGPVLPKTKVDVGGEKKKRNEGEEVTPGV